MADVPVDSESHLDPAKASYVGRRRASVPAEPAPETAPRVFHPEVEVDIAAVARVLSALEPVDQTTSFEHEPTATLPLLRAEATEDDSPRKPSVAGKRRAVKHAGSRGPLFKSMPSAPVLLGIAALAISVGGTVTATEPEVAPTSAGPVTHGASALGGASGVGSVTERGNTVSRDSGRDAQADAAGEKLQQAAEGLAKQRNTALAQLAQSAEAQAKVIAKNVWQYPLDSVSLTARFGQYGLWSSYHTGLDFNGDSGDPIYAVANGEVISASYDGAYGNKTVVLLEDGTEIWYAHQNAFAVSVGDVVRAGELIGYVGATGNVTGSHLHLEVRPGGGDPVDPYAAMQQHELF